MDKTLAIRIDAAIHKQIKMRLAKNGLTLKEYVLCLIGNDLKDSRPLTFDSTATDIIISEETIKEAQKVLDFAMNILSSQGGQR